MNRADRIAERLRERFAPSLMEVRDDSRLHAGHAGAAPGGETHYHVTLISAAFEGMGRVDRSRSVHAALAEELDSGLHALALTLRTPDEAERNK